MKRRHLICVLAGARLVPAQGSASFPLRFDLLAASLASLPSNERQRIDSAIGLIRKGEHLAALAPLLEVTRSNPQVSGARVVLAYAMLQAGNLAGAFEHARQAEKSSDRTTYVCLFLARLAALVGNTDVCRRELKHISGDAQLRADAQDVERQLEARKGKGR
jgi:hypothetical protein